MNMSDERWMPVPGWEDRYEVSDLGNVRSLFHGEARALKPVVTNGYHIARLSRPGQPLKAVAVHRLVMAAFVGPCPEGQQVDHINAVRSDNRLINLRYVTRLENMANAVRLAAAGGARIGRPPSENPRTAAALSRYTADEAAAIIASKPGMTIAAAQREIVLEWLASRGHEVLS